MVGDAGLWAFGSSPDTSTTEDHARAELRAIEREKKALPVCEGCQFLKKVQFNLKDMYICNGLASVNPSSRAIASVLEEKICPVGKTRRKPV
jgi:hypothetical protein